MWKKKGDYRAVLLAACALCLSISGCGGGGGGSSTDSLSSSPPSEPTPILAESGRGPADILLTWSAPTERVNGSALAIAEIGGYQICYIGSDGQINLVDIADPLQTDYLLKNLSPDEYQLNIFTYDTENNLSSPSPTVTLPISSFPRA